MMKGLKITISTIVILLLLIFLALPIGIGLWTKHSYKRLIETLPPTANISVKLVKYNLGWFHSTATVAVDLHPQNPVSTKSSDVRIIFYNDIKQGPVIFAKKSDGANKTIFALSQTAISAPSINFKATATWQFDNKIKSLFSSKHLKLNFSGMVLETKGLRGIATYNYSSKRWEANTNIDSGSLSSQLSPQVPPKTLATFTDVAYAGSVHRAGLLGYGKQSLSFGALKIISSHDGQKNSVINNLTFTSNVGHNEDTTNFQLTLNANKVDDSGFNINSFTLNFSAEDLNTNALNNLLKVSRAQRENSKSPVAFAKITGASMSLFRQGFSLKLKQLHLDTSQGRVDARGYLTLPKLSKQDSVMKARALASGELRLQVPKQWLVNQIAHSISLFKSKEDNASHSSLDQAIMMVQRLEKEGYLLPTGNDYVSAVSYKDGKLLINGKAPNLKKKPNIQTPSSPSLQPSNNTGQGSH